MTEMEKNIIDLHFQTKDKKHLVRVIDEQLKFQERETKTEKQKCAQRLVESTLVKAYAQGRFNNSR